MKTVEILYLLSCIYLPVSLLKFPDGAFKRIAVVEMHLKVSCCWKNIVEFT